MNDLPLEGVRVLEISAGFAAAFAGRMLGGYGADVVCVGEPRELSDDERLWLMAGVRRVNAGSASAIQPLLATADIVLIDWRLDGLTPHAAEIEAALRQRTDVLVVSVTPFGQSGPYAHNAATNITSFAMGGIMSLTGNQDREPLVTGGSQALALGGINAFSAAITGYYGLLMTGEGDWVDISLQECAAGMLELYGPGSASANTGPAPRRGNHLRAVWGIYPCADGWAGVCCLERQIPPFFRLLDDPVLADERFADQTLRAENDDELTAMVYNWFADKPRAELLRLGAEHRVPFGAVLTPLDLLSNPSLEERGFFDDVTTPAGTARIPGRPFPGFEWRTGQLLEPVGAATVGAQWTAAAKVGA